MTLENGKIKICKNCVMDTTDLDIKFDEKGICDHCNSFYKSILPNWNYGIDKEEKLDNLIKKIKSDGIGKDFDCIIGMSGGVDSSYLLYLATKIFGLRPLVFHVDGGWNSQIAVNNIEKLVDDLQLDLFTKVINWEEMADLQRSFFKSGVPHIDTPQDHAFFATMYQFASKHKVKHILTGANYSTECIRNPVNWMYFQSDVSQIKDIQRKFGSIKLKSFPFASIFWYKIWLPFFRGIKIHHPLDLVNYNKSDAIKLLKQLFGWQPYSQKHFESRFTKFYESFWLPERFGIDVRKVQFSSLILTNQMKRKDAINQLKNKSYDQDTITHDIEFVCNKLEITKLEFNDMLKAPKKTYKDYKNIMKIYVFGSWFLRRFGNQLGGKR